MKRKFVSIGECMVEMAPAHDAATYTMGYAGDTLNTAWYARKLLGEDWMVSYVTAVGTDGLSDSMIQFFSAAGIDTADVVREPEKTVGLYMIQLTEGERSFAYWRSDSAARQLASDGPSLAAKLVGAELIYFSGITLAILPDKHREGFWAALIAARDSGAKIAFDPNLRLRLWNDAEDMCKTVSAAAAFCDIVLPSFEDEAAFFGDKTPEETACRYAKTGTGLVVVKNGPMDIFCLDQGKLTSHLSIPVSKVIDTTAAGDSFNAGFLSAYLKGRDLAQSVQIGNQIASQVIGQRGALVALEAIK